MNVLPKQLMIATQWNGHGDHHNVSKSCGSTWEYFPNEDDTNFGLLSGSFILVEKGDWIVECPTLCTTRVYKPAAFNNKFLPEEPGRKGGAA